VNEVTLQNAEHFGGFLVQMRRDECTGFHPDMYHRRTQRVVSIQRFYLDVSGVAWKRQVHLCDVRRFHNFVKHDCSPYLSEFNDSPCFPNWLGGASEFLRNAEWPCHVCFIGILSSVILSLSRKCKLSSQLFTCTFHQLGFGAFSIKA